MNTAELQPKSEKWYRNFFYVLSFGFLFFVGEYIIKNTIISNFGAGQSSDLGIATLRFVANEKMALSIPVHQGILVVAGLLILFGLIQYFTVCCRDGLYANVWALNFVIWGAFSNLYDRITRGFVVDYIDLGFLPVFNLSDLAIFGGLITLLILISEHEKQTSLKMAEA